MKLASAGFVCAYPYGNHGTLSPTRFVKVRPPNFSASLTDRRPTIIKV